MPRVNSEFELRFPTSGAAASPSRRRSDPNLVSRSGSFITCRTIRGKRKTSTNSNLRSSSASLRCWTSTIRSRKPGDRREWECVADDDPNLRADESCWIYWAVGEDVCRDGWRATLNLSGGVQRVGVATPFTGCGDTCNLIIVVTTKMGPRNTSKNGAPWGFSRTLRDEDGARQYLTHER